MAILFVASESFELKPFAGRLTGLRPLKWPVQYAEEGVWQGKRYLLAANGAGPKLAARCVEMALRATASGVGYLLIFVVTFVAGTKSKLAVARVFAVITVVLPA